MEQHAIPVIVLSGFLGSGKTTLLLRLLQHAKSSGLRASVLMNEIGSVDVDGTQVSSESAYQLLERVTEGCLCCTKKSELAQCLERLALMRPDVIVMELTGVANPEEIVDAMTEPSVIGKAALHRIVTVLDAEHALDYNSIFSSDRELIRTLRRQIEVADIIVANKFDLISNRTADKVRALVKDRNGSAMFVSAVRCELDAAPIFEGISAAAERRQPVISGTRPSASIARAAAGSAGLPQAAVPRGGSAFAGAGGAAAQPIVRVSAGAGAARSGAPGGAGPADQPAAGSGPSSAGKTSRGNAAAASAPGGSFSRIRTAAIYPDAEAAGVTRRQFEAFLGGRGSVCLRAKGYMPYGKDGRLMLFQLAGKRLEWSPSTYEGAPYFVMIGIDLDEAKIKQEWERLARK
ncbi:CobW family GTP-binding protein [Paenibacillus sacheonensis]|uniref:GTP-binding protein n=1 Tax=Paenibacillus sacheonensis TaxID=742054 RepID=A0A7X5C260_9BACL|nr:CobW family GTP-binding protein [Paenibacillus sacheonensis]MBM7565215.1 G3E family GTPase [Paenibacillus sacheonensis]NBC70009.1 GTP-binding protein [Paenibacillus sacheonensis]